MISHENPHYLFKLMLQSKCFHDNFTMETLSTTNRPNNFGGRRTTLPVTKVYSPSSGRTKMFIGIHVLWLNLIQNQHPSRTTENNWISAIRQFKVIFAFFTGVQRSLQFTTLLSTSRRLQIYHFLTIESKYPRILEIAWF